MVWLVSSLQVFLVTSSTAFLRFDINKDEYIPRSHQCAQDHYDAANNRTLVDHNQIVCKPIMNGARQTPCGQNQVWGTFTVFKDEEVIRYNAKKHGVSFEVMAAQMRAVFNEVR